MRFTKMHGLGNDYVYVDLFQEDLAGVDLERLARAVSNRNFGVGSDGLILIGPASDGDFSMRMFNSDGSEGGMCGNGMRCLARYVFEEGYTDKTSFQVVTKSGIVRSEVKVVDGEVAAVRVDLGPPGFGPSDIPVSMIEVEARPEEPLVGVPIPLEDRTYHATLLSLGNPHCVVLVDDVEGVPLGEVGPVIEGHRLFPDRANVEFIQDLGKQRLRMRVWERGSGITMACGSGAAAAGVAAVLNGIYGRGQEITIVLDGGELQMIWSHDGSVFIEGPAVRVFDGDLDLTALAWKG